MKRFLVIFVLSLAIVQLCLLPIAVTAFEGPSVVTLPASNITDSTATLNGTVDLPSAMLIVPNGVFPASLRYALGHGITVSFQYGTVPGTYTGETQPQPIAISLDTPETFPFQATVSGLSPCTTYYARAKMYTITSVPLIFNQYGEGIKGAGVGLDYKILQQLFIVNHEYDGSEISFQTTGCQIGTGSHGSSVSGTTTTQPVGLPNIVTQSASLSARSVTPGTPVTVTADVINKSAVNGNKKVTLYVNGQVETTQGVTVNSGGSSKLTFNVSRSEPGDYNVYVDGVPAGSFKVEMVTEPNTILMFSIALIAIAFLFGMIMLWRRQRAG